MGIFREGPPTPAPTSRRGKIFAWPKRQKECRSELGRLLKQDRELCEFFKFVKENDLRERAVEVLSQRMAHDENCP